MKKQFTTVELLAKVVEQLKLVNSKLDFLAQQNAELLKIYDAGNAMPLSLQADVMTLLKLPLSLRKTAVALYKVERATAADIAKATGRSRPVESDCANQLVRMGLASKTREGMVIYFSIEPGLEIEK
jgi:hypothetical protein